MRLSMLGTGTSASHFGAHADTRLPPGYLLEVEGERILLECPELVRMRLQELGVAYETVAHIVISHGHADHCALLHFLQSLYCKALFGGPQFARAQLQIYCPAQVQRDFDLLWTFHFPNQSTRRFGSPEVCFTALSGTDAVASAQIGTLRLTAYPVHHGHGRCDAVAVRFESAGKVLAYSGDSGVCSGLAAAAAGADLFLCEAGAPLAQAEAAKEYGHLTAYQAGQIAAEAGVRQLVLTHYIGIDSPGEMTAAVRQSGYRGTLHLALDLEVFEL